MKDGLRLALAQIDVTVGDLAGNRQRITNAIGQAQKYGADIVAFPELAITGYPPEDLLLKPKFIADNLKELQALAKETKDLGEIAVVVGFVDRQGRDIFNAAAVIYQGQVKGVYHKTYLPNYGVFDEKRYFKAGQKPEVFQFGDPQKGGRKIGIIICEDIWYPEGPVKSMVKGGADLIININASPYHAGKIILREKQVTTLARDNKVTIAYVNLVGGQDELVFDGQSLVAGETGKVIGRSPAFKEDILLIDLPAKKGARTSGGTKPIIIADKIAPKNRLPIIARQIEPLPIVEEVYGALALGLKDYVHKTGFNRVVIGLSGGIDSALVATLAVDALGAKNVNGVFMPSRYSSEESFADAHELARNLGINMTDLPIEQVYHAYLVALSEIFRGRTPDITEENLQARIRGTLLMALSNKFGWLVLTTGNKSEMGTGYATLYGDMAGGFAVIKDVPKTLVYQLAQSRNKRSPAIPARVLVKEPTAELRPNQKDSDSLPPYKVLDPILKAYVEEDKDLEQIAAAGFKKETISRVLNLVDKSEYKRRQAPPGIKITPKSFGKDRRMPISNRYLG